MKIENSKIVYNIDNILIRNECDKIKDIPLQKKILINNVEYDEIKDDFGLIKKLFEQ
jgi:hypothetical protein